MKKSEQKVITTTLYKGIAIVASSLLVGGVTGAIAWAGIINTDHFTLSALADDVSSLKDDKVGKEIYISDMKTVKEGIQTLQTSIVGINNYLINNKFCSK